jgi:FlaA1/EpsC-like NDP-sugar epimerase
VATDTKLQRTYGQMPVRLAQFAVDLFIFSLAYLSAYVIRFEGELPLQSAKQLVVLLPYVVLARFAANGVFGVYRVVWRYIGLREVVRFGYAVASVSAVLLAFRFLYPTHHPYLKVPLGIIVLEGTLAFAGLAGSRILRRLVHERTTARARQLAATTATRTILVGAGEAGLAICKEVLRSRDLGIHIVAFVDDDPGKQGLEVNGVRVRGRIADLAEVMDRSNAHQVFITTNAIPARTVLQLTDLCRARGVAIRIVPRLYEVLGTEVHVGMLREVQIEDILNRDPIAPSMSFSDLQGAYQGRTILVTGAGGSIGSELCRQLLQLEPVRLILIERDENNLFEIERELCATRSQTTCVPVLADLADPRTIDRVFHKYRPNTVFHAAAYKHVPMMEAFPSCAVQNNILATRDLVAIAARYETEAFLMVSTDKAVNPTSVMGATKRVAELIVQQAASHSPTRFSCVRFGNVLGSRGSVVGIFRSQILAGRPVTVTHEDATRYFMTIQEAVNLVLQAATIGRGGDVYVLDMGEPVRILDLARQMIHLSGMSEEQIPIEVIGTRPGEKLFEELRLDEETVEQTPLRKVFRCRPMAANDRQLDAALERFEFLARARDDQGVREALSALGIAYNPPPVRAPAAMLAIAPSGPTPSIALRPQT